MSFNTFFFSPFLLNFSGTFVYSMEANHKNTAQILLENYALLQKVIYLFYFELIFQKSI